MAAVVLLAGRVGASHLSAQLGRATLDLPLDATRVLWDAWQTRLSEVPLPSRDQTDSPRVVVLMGESAVPPTRLGPVWGDDPQVMRDTGEFRGTGGALHDMSRGLDRDAYLLVGSASQCPDAGFVNELLATANDRADVWVGTARLGRPTGVMLLRVAALDHVPAVGFHDLKEQVLPQLVRDHVVRVAVHNGCASLPVRTPELYVSALRSWHLTESLAGTATSHPYLESWQTTFSVVETGAEVDPSALVRDSVILAGARIGADAVVVRSVIASGAVVRPRERIMDLCVPGRGGDRPRGGRHEPA